jgi:hypothetical protein
MSDACGHSEIKLYIIEGVRTHRCLGCAQEFVESCRLSTLELRERNGMRQVAELEQELADAQKERDAMSRRAASAEADWQAAESRLSRLQLLVNEQAEDEGLWAVPIPPQSQPISEAYLQQELRRLHAAIEGEMAVESAVEIVVDIHDEVRNEWGDLVVEKASPSGTAPSRHADGSAEAAHSEPREWSCARHGKFVSATDNCPSCAVEKHAFQFYEDKEGRELDELFKREDE